MEDQLLHLGHTVNSFQQMKEPTTLLLTSKLYFQPKIYQLQELVCTWMSILMIMLKLGTFTDKHFLTLLDLVQRQSEK